MKIVKRREFLKLPAGTLYSKYVHCAFEELQIKGDSLANDWFYQEIASAIDNTGSDDWSNKLFKAAETGESLPMDFNCQGRDGCFESDEQMFAIWEHYDVMALIQRLQAALSDQATS
jgi:hypothetical protein